MRLRSFLVIGVALFAGLTQWAVAQSGEASVNYSLVVYNPAKSVAGTRELNGGGGSVGAILGQYVTMKGEIQAYTTTTLTYHLKPSSHTAGGTFESQANMYTFLAGPQLNYSLGRKRLFGEAIFGSAYTDGYANLFRAAHVTGLSASNRGFAMAFGGGIDLPITEHIGLRVAQLDYFMTRYEWKPLGINNQSNFRYQGGLVFVFGGGGS